VTRLRLIVALNDSRPKIEQENLLSLVLPLDLRTRMLREGERAFFREPGVNRFQGFRCLVST